MDKNELFKSRLKTGEYEIPGVGVVKFRALSRKDVLSLRGEFSIDEMERLMLSKALIDPVITVEEAGLWQEASGAGELEPLTRLIMDLSGVNQEAPKEAMKQF